MAADLAVGDLDAVDRDVVGAPTRPFALVALTRGDDDTDEQNAAHAGVGRASALLDPPNAS
jgi:hypothetical protein